MKRNTPFLEGEKRLIIAFLLVMLPLITDAQIYSDRQIGFGLHFDPVISWFGSDTKETMNKGARPGYNFGLTFNRYFSSNYAFSAGISMINAGGRLVSNDTTVLEFANISPVVLPGEPVTYKIQYISLPVGLKLKTNQIGYITFFSDLGLDPKVVIGGKADIKSPAISKENATNELRFFNLSYHITAGIEYSLGGSTAFVAGLNFENNFLDITSENGIQLPDKVTHKLLSFRFGINF